MSRSSFSFASNATKRTALPAAAVATSAQVLPVQGGRTAVSLLNKTDAIVKVFLCDLATKTSENLQTVELAIGGYYEDPRNYQGPITIEGGATGSVICTEWL